MRKGQETGLVMIISTIILIIIIIQFILFAIFFSPKVIISPDSQSYLGMGYVETEISLDSINFAKLNSDLIIKSIKDNNYANLEKEIDKLEFNGCWEIKIKDKTFKKDSCKIKDLITTTTSIPDYNNNKIQIILNKQK